MRIISGKYGSRPLKAVPGNNTRPTTDKIKESMFNLIGGIIDGGYVLDLFGGSGALAIEAISRGGSHAVICEKYRPAIDTIQKNIEMTRDLDNFTVIKGDNRTGLKRYLQSNPSVQFKWVFIDPPYKAQQIVENIQWLNQINCLSQDAVILCESDNQTELPDNISNWILSKEKTYGLTKVRIYRRGV